MRTLVLISLLLMLSASSTLGAEDRIFYQWTTEDGVLGMADDPKRVPSRYRGEAIKRTSSSIGKGVQVTEVAIPAAEYRVRIQASLKRLQVIRAATTVFPNQSEGCDGPIVVTKERHTHTPLSTSWTGTNTYNSMFYVVRNSCGERVSATLVNPEAEIEIETSN